jgi:hypothetical protein
MKESQTPNKFLCKKQMRVKPKANMKSQNKWENVLEKIISNGT